MGSEGFVDDFIYQDQQPWRDQRNDAVVAHDKFTAAPSRHQVLGASGASPSSQLSSGCAMAYTSDHVPEQAAAHLKRSDSSASDVLSEGWFSKCRGCGCMTAHEKMILGAEVPFCRRCQGTLNGCSCPDVRAKMLDTLLFVHQEWSKAGL